MCKTTCPEEEGNQKVYLQCQIQLLITICILPSLSFPLPPSPLQLLRALARLDALRLRRLALTLLVVGQLVITAYAVLIIIAVAVQGSEHVAVACCFCTG